MKKIMILGAGIYQVPLIKCAKKMGLYTIVVSIPGNYPGFKFADKIYYENTTDSETIIEIAKKEQVNGICTTGTDVAVITIGKVCDELGLAGISVEGAKIACDKSLMKDAYRKNDVRTAPYRYVHYDDDISIVREVCDEIGYPVIFKAIDSSGSRGITRVNNPDEIKNAISAAKNVTRHNTFLIEKFLIGEEFGAQAFVQNGKLEFVLPHGDYVYMGNTGVPIGHYAPYDVPEMESDIFDQTEKAFKAMKLNNCAMNIDFILCDGKTYVLEIGARGGATCLIELVSLYYGFDYYEKIIQVALGETADFTPVNKKRQPNGGHLLMSDKAGIIKSIDNKNVIGENGVVDIGLDYGVGDTVRKFNVGPDRIGHVVVVGDDLDEVKRRLSLAVEKIRFVIE